MTYKEEEQLPIVRDGTELLTDVGSTPIVTAATVELVPFLKDRECYVTGVELLRRARDLDANLGEHQALQILEHVDDIPKEFYPFHLVLPGTIREMVNLTTKPPTTFRYVPFLDPISGLYALNYYWVGSNFFGHIRLLRFTG